MKQQQKHQLRTIIALTKKVSGQWFGCLFFFYSLPLPPPPSVLLHISRSSDVYMQGLGV